MSATLHIEPNQCIGCAICADVCPNEALVLERTDILPRLITERCTACGICVQQCPTGAINLPVFRHRHSSPALQNPEH